MQKAQSAVNAHSGGQAQMHGAELYPPMGGRQKEVELLAKANNENVAFFICCAAVPVLV